MGNIWLKIKMAFIYLWGMITGRGKSPNFEKFEIGSSDVQALVKFAYPEATVSMSDYRYKYITLKDWKKILGDCCSNNAPYDAEFHDCDDFADYLKGHVSNDFGINTCLRASGRDVSGGAHAFNIIVYQDGQTPRLAIVEPQTGEIGCKYAVSVVRG
jgi:hypothetical protein